MKSKIHENHFNLCKPCCYARGCSRILFLLKQPVIGASYGAGEQNTSSFNPYLEYSVKANKYFSYQLKITSVYANGFLGSNFNLGDIFGFVNYVIKSKSINKLSFLSGIKIPLSYSNDKNKNGM